jgi:hypothetical protein
MQEEASPQLVLLNIANVTSPYALRLEAHRNKAIQLADKIKSPQLQGLQPRRKHKSARQIEKELQRISERERADEVTANDQLAAIIAKLDKKVRAQWLELPDKLAALAKALMDIAERLRLNTPTMEGNGDDSCVYP